MANSTSFIRFPLFRNYNSQGVGKDIFGYFYTKLSTAKFLDIVKVSTDTQIALVKDRKQAKVRDFTLLDGTVLKKSEDNADGQNESSAVLASISTSGTNSIYLVSGKKTPNGNYKKAAFRFPSFATNLVISDALGSILPPGKVKADPTEADVFNYFISKGGRRYPILTKAAADALTSSTTPTTQTAAELLAQSIANNQALKAE